VDRNKHGLHVAGIIGARHGNRRGIDGACRYCDLHLASITGKNSKSGQPHEYFDTLFRLFSEAAEEEVPPKVINASLGFNWKKINFLEKQPNETDKKQLRQQAEILKPVLQKLADKKVIVVSAAGNDSHDHPVPLSCEWGNIINYTALNSQPRLNNVLIVEAIDRTEKRCSFSNINGSVAAAGDKMHSLSHYDHNYAANPGAVLLLDGTSQATPLVTALVAQMYAYNSKLTMDKVITIIQESSRPTAGGQKVIDAFEAMLRSHPDSLTHLADLDGDGKVTADDEKRLLQAQLAQQPATNYWPREDLNGDGKVSDDRRRVWVPRANAHKDLNDFEVLREAQMNR